MNDDPQDAAIAAFRSLLTDDFLKKAMAPGKVVTEERQLTDASESTIEVLPRGSNIQQRRGSSRPVSIANPIASKPKPKAPSSMNRISKTPMARSRPAGGRGGKSPLTVTRSSSSWSRKPEQTLAVPKVQTSTPSASRPSLRAKPHLPPRYGLERENGKVITSQASIPLPRPRPVRKKFGIGLDFGTTFTSVAYVVHNVDEKNPRVFPRDVKSIVNWPEDCNGGARAQVPTELWYSPVSISRESSTDDSDTSDTGGESDDEYQARRLHSRGRQPAKAQASNSVFDRNRHAASSGKYAGWSPADEEDIKHLWGYGVHYQKYRSSASRDIMGHIDRAKLMLVESKHTRGDRKKLRPRLKYLIERGTIRKHGDVNTIEPADVKDVLADFLTKVLGHAKQQLIEREGYTSDSPVTFALTVPAIWPVRSSRILQGAVQEAIKRTEFGTLVNGSLENVFIVSEPEAAATFLLESAHKMMAGETFTVLDCGGGTVDGSTYTTTNTYPLRLKIEVGKLSGDNCGASYLNDAFEERLLKRLEDEHYLDCNGETREDIVRYATLEFENRDKRMVDIARRPVGEVKIPGLQGDEQRKKKGLKPKNFKPGYVLLNKDDYDEIFIPCLQRTAAVLEEQFVGAKQLGIDIKKVFLIGGFGAAPSLRSFLGRYLVEFAREQMLNYDIELLVTNEQDSVTAIAAGATLRALNLDHGPKRQAVSSYGFLRKEPYQPFVGEEALEGHLEANINIDPFNGHEYVSVIDYFLHKNEIIPAKCQYEAFTCTHAFAIDDKRFKCEEILYVNDSDDTKSSYDLTHVRNRGAQAAGRIIVDMTFLRDENHISPVIPEGVVGGKPHYEVTYALVPVVEGRDLKYLVRYPADESGMIIKTAQVSIAAAFEPGTG